MTREPNTIADVWLYVAFLATPLLTLGFGIVYGALAGDKEKHEADDHRT